MLKLATKCYEKDVFEYVRVYKKVISRIVLRYAIEKMLKELKVLTMGKSSFLYQLYNVVI